MNYQIVEVLHTIYCEHCSESCLCRKFRFPAFWKASPNNRLTACLYSPGKRISLDKIFADGFSWSPEDSDKSKQPSCAHK